MAPPTRPLLAASSILIVAVLCGVSAAKVNLYEFCLDLERQIDSTLVSRTDAVEILKEAQKHMKSTFSFGPVSKLSEAWEAVVKEEPCGTNRAKIVTTIAECNPSDKGTLATLFAAVQRYSMRCLTPAFWDEQLDKTLGSSDKSGLTKFMDEPFLTQYRKDNANERKLHLTEIGAGNCCQPDRSHAAIVESLKPALKVKGHDQVLKVIRTDRNRLETALDRHLFKPCKRYLASTSELMWEASRAGKYQPAGEQAFIQSLSQRFQDAIFRYKYCINFQFKTHASGKLDEINVMLFD